MTETSTALALQDRPGGVVYEMTVQDIVRQSEKITECMRRAMKSGEHFGTIPGTDKPTLLKPGAEKLCLMFRFNPEYEIVEHVDEDDRVSYVIRCLLIHIPTGERIATGMGSCTSRETKYRFRLVATDLKPERRDADILKAKGAGRWKKVGEKDWLWMERVVNDNCRDLDNTLLKMACKRALVAAVLNGTAASDVFTQDLEDLDDHAGEEVANAQQGRQQATPAQQARPAQQAGNARQAAPQGGQQRSSAPPAQAAKPNGAPPAARPAAAQQAKPADAKIGRVEFEHIETAREQLGWDQDRFADWLEKGFGVRQAVQITMGRYRELGAALDKALADTDPSQAPNT